MKIYSSQNQARYLDELKKYQCGVMLIPSYKIKPSSNKQLREFPLALDNGAFTAYKKEYPFQERMFLQYIEWCFSEQFKLDFIVAPDIVAGGMDSAYFSLEWITGKLKTAPNLAFVVQDGMTPKTVIDLGIGGIKNIKVLFVGGSKIWKIQSLPEWLNLSKSLGLKIHVGQIGSVENLKYCFELGVDSIDSQSFSRNNTWHYLDEFRDPLQKTF